MCGTNLSILACGCLQAGSLIIFLGGEEENPGITVQTSTDSLERNVREVVGKPAEIRPIHGLFQSLWHCQESYAA